MAKPKKKLTAAQKATRKRRKRDFEIVFIGCKQLRMIRKTIDGLDADEFIRRNADAIWLQKNGRFERIFENVD